MSRWLRGEDVLAGGCHDGFSATVQLRRVGSLPTGPHRIEVLADGASLGCTFRVPLGTTDRADGSTGLSVLVAPASAQVVETITVAGTPGQVHAWQYVDDVAILDAAAAPSYGRSGRTARSASRSAGKRQRPGRCNSCPRRV